MSLPVYSPLAARRRPAVLPPLSEYVTETGARDTDPEQAPKSVGRFPGRGLLPGGGVFFFLPADITRYRI